MSAYRPFSARYGGGSAGEVLGQLEGRGVGWAVGAPALLASKVYNAGL